MEVSAYVALGRQSGLMRELSVVANNIANLSTVGYRREGLVFAEHVRDLDGAPPVSMAHATGRIADMAQGTLTATGGSTDFAIEGEGFFLVDTPGGQRLTRAGNFTPLAGGELATPDGFRLLDEGGSPVVLPPGVRDLALAGDGTLSANGQPIARIGLWLPSDPAQLRREAGTAFDGGTPVPAEGGTLLQGMLEDSNVNPIEEVARMIELQRAYDIGQSLLDREDQRVKLVIETLGR